MRKVSYLLGLLFITVSLFSSCKKEINRDVISTTNDNSIVLSGRECGTAATVPMWAYGLESGELSLQMMNRLFM
jgi:hypothetical protein